MRKNIFTETELPISSRETTGEIFDFQNQMWKIMIFRQEGGIPERGGSTTKPLVREFHERSDRALLPLGGP